MAVREGRQEGNCIPVLSIHLLIMSLSHRKGTFCVIKD